jgi:N-acetylmuramic acid 6-phosphate etherase
MAPTDVGGYAGLKYQGYGLEKPQGWGIVSAMMGNPEPTRLRYLGIEGGGTRTVALLADGRGQALRRLETGPANLKLLTEAQLTQRFRSIARALPRPGALGIGLSGAWVEADFKKIRSAAAKAWPGIPCYATNDLETALIAAGGPRLGETTKGFGYLSGEGGPFPVTPALSPSEGERENRRQVSRKWKLMGREDIPQVLIVSGTGSSCYGKTSNGRAVKVGGWGHVLGDKGSGYDIGRQALRAVIDAYDHEGLWPPLGRRLLRTLELNQPTDLIDWAQAAEKPEIASLAAEVLAVRGREDKIAREISADAARSLARDAAACARKLARPGTQVQFVLTGSILLKQPRFGAQVSRELRKLWPGAAVTPLEREGVWGAVELARQALQPKVQSPKSKVQRAQVEADVVRSVRQSPTEERNPCSMRLDKMPLGDAVTLMLSEDARVPRKLMGERRHIEQVIRAVVQAFRRGGRLFYVGAGTSGRLGVLDASECPPTFRTPPDMVQGVIAGGQNALWQSLEGAEDDAEAGARAIGYRGVTRRDLVVGIAASGTTPFVWGALREARRHGAKTVLVCFNPFLRMPRSLRPAIVIAPNLGPELLTGSTRLKAGTATKLLLNMFTTLAMVRIGKVRSNLMIDVNPANEKLRDRAVRIVRALTGADYLAAQQALERSDWVIKEAVARPGRK